MRFLFINHIIESAHSIRSNRVRSFLTGLGVAIGVASITVILSLSQGMTSVIDKQITDQDGSIAIVRPGQPKNDLNSLTQPVSQETYSISNLTENDVASIAKIEGVTAVAPLMKITSSLSADGDTVEDAVVIATTPELEKTTKLPIREGQFLDNIINNHTAVIGHQLSIDLFGTEMPIGQTFVLKNERYRVIGVFKKMDDPINYNNVDFDRAAVINMESGKSLNRSQAQIQQINIRVASPDLLTAVVQQAVTKISNNHLGEKDFYIASGSEIAEPTSRLFTAVSTGMIAIAAVSLLVGGIGIMNIMLVNVAERTREIGLRKAVGASNWNIVWQFLTESLMISIFGGAFGYVLGYSIAFVASTFLTFRPAITWDVGLIAFVISVTIGTVFGLYPAIRASRKSPIESLRSYS